GLYLPDIDEKRNDEQRTEPQYKRTGQSVKECFLTLFFRKVFHHDSEHQRIIGSQETLQTDQYNKHPQIFNQQLSFHCNLSFMKNGPHQQARTKKRPLPSVVKVSLTTIVAN